MRIVQVCPRYYPHIGGIEHVVTSIAERLTSLGCEVTVLAGEPWIKQPKEELIRDVKVIRWPTWAPNGAYHIPKIRGELKATLKILLEDADVVHVHSIHALTAYYAWKFWKKYRKDGPKFVITPYYHGSGHTTLRKMLWSFWGLYAGRILKDANIVHTVSRLEARLVKKDFGVEAVSIENGVEEFIRNIEWRPNDYALYSGRIEKYKNVHKLAQILQILNTQYGTSLKLLVVGDGSYKKDLMNKLKTLDLQWNVKPFQPFKSYIDCLSHAVFLGLLSERESYPQSVNEANAIGTPVVIAEPWAENFSGRTRTLSVNLADGEAKIALKIKEFLEECPHQPKPKVPTWTEVARAYLSTLYS